MARAAVVYVKCDRCQREELQPDSPQKQKADFEATYDGKSMVFMDVCAQCRFTLDNLWRELKEWEKPIISKMWKNGAEDKAPPLNPSPDYSPPKPHSGSKK